MGITNLGAKLAGKAADQVAKMASLSPEQMIEVQELRAAYLTQMPNPQDQTAEELTKRLLAAGSVEIHKTYLAQLGRLYAPLQRQTEPNTAFDAEHNIRFFNISKWVEDKNESAIEKLVNVYQVLSNETCNISLVFHRSCEGTQVYLALTNTKNASDHVDVTQYQRRLQQALQGNFPGAEISKAPGQGILPCLQNDYAYSVAAASNIPSEKSEKFLSQSIDKLLDGIVPTRPNEEYTLILLATPVQNIAEQKLRLAELYSGLTPYAAWSTNFTLDEHSSTGSSANVGVNLGASAGAQHGNNQSLTSSSSTANTTGSATTSSTSQALGSNTATTQSKGSSDTFGGSVGINSTTTAGVNASAGFMGTGVGASASQSVGGSLSANYAHGLTRSVAETVGSSVVNTLSNAVTSSMSEMVSTALATARGASQALTSGLNFGVNFARTSNVTATIGKSESLQQHFANFNIQYTLKLLEAQMKRLELSTALGMWSFAAYVLSEDHNVAQNVAHSYVALTQGEESHMAHAAVNVWRGDTSESGDAKEVCGYLRELRHPVFGLDPNVVQAAPDCIAYPPVVTATEALSGKELAWSLNFPQKSISGLPVMQCAAFGRNVASYDLPYEQSAQLNIGRIFHMNHEERLPVALAKESLAAHTFITGSTGAGKSNAVYTLLDQAQSEGVSFLVIEPAKGEYKHVFGSRADVSVYGTNPNLAPLLRINPFSFPKGIHILEHLDRLVELFNVCWPMYAAMPAILKSAVESSYCDCGWDLLRSTNPNHPEQYPTFGDVARNIREQLDASDYDADNKGAYKGALLTRLQSLSTGINGMVFGCNEIAMQDLFDKNVIVDLSRMGSSETKSLLMGMLVLKLQEHRMASATSMNAKLQHITVLEEAHNLLQRTAPESSAESANLRGKSVEMLANAIAEMRSYGEGFVIADQAPGLLDASVIRNTNTKLILRLPDQSDRELVGRAANLNEEQITELAKLPRGVAAVYQTEWVQPVLCKLSKHAGAVQPFAHHPTANQSLLASDADLLAAIAGQLPLQRDGDFCELKRLVARSGLDAKQKTEFVKTVNTNPVGALQNLLYEWLGGQAAVQKARHCTEIHEWRHTVQEHMVPSLQALPTEKRNAILKLVVLEQARRDADYNDILCRFTEICQEERGGIIG